MHTQASRTSLSGFTRLQYTTIYVHVLVLWNHFRCSRNLNVIDIQILKRYAARTEMACQKSVQSKLITQLHSMMHSNKKVWCNIQHGRYETWMLHSHTPSWMKPESLSDRVRSITSHSTILQCLKLTDWLQTSLKPRTRLGGWINTICACALITAHSASYFRSAFPARSCFHICWLFRNGKLASTLTYCFAYNWQSRITNQAPDAYRTSTIKHWACHSRLGKMQTLSDRYKHIASCHTSLTYSLDSVLPVLAALP